MRNIIVKGIVTPIVMVVVSMLILTACKKPLPEARFGYSIQNGSFYSTLYLTNYSVNADSYEWTLTRPDGTKDISYSFEPSFKCYQIGTHKITLYASNKYGTDRATQSFEIYDNGGGGGGGGGNDNPTASAYTITWLRLEIIPMLAGDNSSWDTGIFGGADPDIKFKIQNSTNTTTYYTSPVKEDVSSSDFPISWYNVNTTLELGEEYRIQFLDEDGLDSDDIMANCVWKQAGYFAPGATSYTWYSTDRTIKFTVGLSWIYSKAAGCEITQGVPDNESAEGDNNAVLNNQ